MVMEVLLHGDLDLHIIEARNLPSGVSLSKRLRRYFTRAQSRHRHGRRRHKRFIVNDPYVTVRIDGITIARTAVIINDEDPKWDQHFTVPLAHRASRMEFLVMDEELLGAQLVGTYSVPATRIASGLLITDWLPVIGPSGNAPNYGSAVLVSLRFTPAEKIPRKLGVEGTYFPVRKSGRVTLYQDAHVREGELPEIELDEGKVFKQGGCWEDICLAISEAQCLIYITGWSIYHKVKLVREPTRPIPVGGDLLLGDLLEYKAQQGVRVCLLVWEDMTSHDNFLFRTQGVMQTHDKKIRKFFKHSSVICVLSPRAARSKLGIIKQKVVGSPYTHHQKCLLVDTKAYGHERNITAFIGGLDLCDGRYDTPDHRLFTNDDSVFYKDFYNPSIYGETKGPRQPWHDLHCRIEGPAAYDVLMNFEQRWQKGTRFWAFGCFKRFSHLKDDALIKLERCSWIHNPLSTTSYEDPSLPTDDDPESWHVQIFRSIDSGSVKAFPKDVHNVEKQNLFFQKNVVIDKSIHAAYVKAIRSAQHFVYIESQYFLGSSYGWPSYQNAAGADNLIPMELALKIASKIRARERFAVYIIIPMWPEGSPVSAVVQEILFWQSQTIQMMYDIIGQELKSLNIKNAHPQDYLNFYCLGKREPSLGDSFNSIIQPSETSPMVLSQKYRRFMVYVHGNGMILDDEYVILGSANINQRSLDGSRDTEIAMGAYQPHHTWAEKQGHPHGQVHGYRMSLWAEHLGMVDERFKEPHSFECVKLVNQIADDNWIRYTAEEVVPLKGHLIKYPIKVEADGKIRPLPGQECFPDVGGKILGEPFVSIPGYLTT